MPTREEEYAAGLKEPRGEPLCPFYGSPKVYYNERFKSQRCGRCEKSSPSPGYGNRGKPSWFQKLFGRK